MDKHDGTATLLSAFSPIGCVVSIVIFLVLVGILSSFLDATLSVFMSVGMLVAFWAAIGLIGSKRSN